MRNGGTLKPHGKTVGYIVTAGSDVLVLCRGFSGDETLLRTNFGTVFPTLRRARRAVESAIREGSWSRADLDIVRVAGLK